MAKLCSDDKAILTGTIGSHSYGTATATSDYDYMSVVIAPMGHYFGFQSWGSAGTKSDEYNDTEKGLVEHKYFELKKFVGMCQDMNPNAIPLLWLPEELYTVCTPEGQLLVKNRALFNSKKMYKTFSGYAYGQLQKMGGVFNDNEESNRLLKLGFERFGMGYIEDEIKAQRAYRDAPSDGALPGSLRAQVQEAAYDEGYLNALLKAHAWIKEECKRIKDGPITGRMGAKRKELREQYGFDTKFAFHTIRLMKMCVEFLTNPEEGLKVSRKGIDSEFLYSIRLGALSQEEVKALADDLFVQAKEAAKTSPLPDEPDYEAIESLTIQILRSQFA